MMMPLRFDPARVPEAMDRWFESTQASVSPAATLGLADLLLGVDLGDALPSAAVPTLLFAPDSSPFVPVEAALEMQSRIPRAEIRIFPGVRHAVVCWHGDACSRAFREFIERRVALGP